MTYFLIFISVLAFTSNGFAIRLFQTRFKNSERRLPLFQSLYCLISTLCFWGAGSFALPRIETLIYGVIFGVLFCTASAMGAKAMAIGSMALSSVIMNMSLLLPILYSVIFLSEKLTVLHMIGFLLFCASVIFSAQSGGESKKANLLWLITVFVGLLANGGTAIIQKNFIMEYPNAQDSVFLGVAYLTASICFIVKFIIFKNKHTVEAQGASSAKATRKIALLSVATFFAVAMLAGIGSFFGNLLLGKLSVKVVAAILYPCINGGIAVMTPLVSFVIFKEKPSAKKLLSILFGCIAIVVLNLG